MNINELQIVSAFNYMLEYQRKNIIKGKCITNVQYLYDSIKENIKNCNIKIIGVFVTSVHQNIHRLISPHLVLLLDDDIIDPSYEVYSLKNKQYYITFKDLNDTTDIIHSTEYNIKEIINSHICITQIADEMNSGKKWITDEEYYINQADYVQKNNNFIFNS
jgi:hypothetical protein